MADSGSQPYLWRRYRFDVPEGLADETVLTFVEAGPGPSTLSLTMTIDAPPKGAAGLDAYITAQVEEMRAMLDGYQLHRRTNQTAGGMTCVLLEQSSRSTQRTVVHQCQAYVLGEGEVVIITGSSDSAARAKAAVERLSSTLKRE